MGGPSHRTRNLIFASVRKLGPSHNYLISEPLRFKRTRIFFGYCIKVYSTGTEFGPNNGLESGWLLCILKRFSAQTRQSRNEFCTAQYRLGQAVLFFLLCFATFENSSLTPKVTDAGAIFNSLWRQVIQAFLIVLK